jgi:hypothetical protein
MNAEWLRPTPIRAVATLILTIQQWLAVLTSPSLQTIMAALVTTGLWLVLLAVVALLVRKARSVAGQLSSSTSSAD